MCYVKLSASDYERVLCIPFKQNTFKKIKYDLWKK